MFEILKSDLRARIGILHTNHGKVSTPAFVPVIHPVKQSIPSKVIRDMGFEMVITNAYITMNRFGEEAEKVGIHDIIGFDGVVMTDSGGYQVLEYGDISIKPPEMARYERNIRTDIAIPLDKPTGFGIPKEKADQLVRHTLRVSKETLEESEENGQVWVGPIQGGEHLEIVRRSTKSLINMGFEMMALGSPVEFMESYEYGLLAKMIMEAKKHIPHHIPLHLFGAGHPLTVGFSVALGCDTFDSASYMLYAKHGRYITDDGTRRIDDIDVFPCNCKICLSYTPKELSQAEYQERTNNIAIHNLYAIKNEVDHVRQAIFEGRLWEYVMKKARAHPRLYEIIETFTNAGDYFTVSTPAFKEKAIFLFDGIDQFRPEVQNYRAITAKFKSTKKKLVITKTPKIKPAYLSQDYKAIKSKFKKDSAIQFCQYSPHLGIIPIEISDIFPAAHHETARIDFDPRDYTAFGEGLMQFLKNNKFTEIHYDSSDKFLRHFMKMVPAGTKKFKIKK